MTATPIYTILQVSAEYPPVPGGVGDYTYRLSQALGARRHRIIVATGHAPAVRGTAADPVIQPIGGGWSWRSLLSLGNAIQRWQPDLVHIQYQTGAYGMHPAINLAPWFIRLRFPKPRIVVTMHDLRMPYLFPKAAPIRRWVTQRLLQDAHAIIVTNEADQDALNGVGADREHFVAHEPMAATVIPIGSNIDVAPPVTYDRDRWRSGIGANPQDSVVAFFGLVSATKGLLPLVEAFAMLPRHIRLLVIGGEAHQPQDQRYLAEVRAAVQRLNLAQRIFFTGHCEPTAVSGHLLASDLVALPFSDGASYRRGSLLAAFAHERAVLTTAPEAPLTPPLHSGEHAWFVQPDATSQLANAIMRLVAEPDLRMRLAKQGRQLMNQFGWPSIATRHEDVYNALVQPMSSSV